MSSKLNLRVATGATPETLEMIIWASLILPPNEIGRSEYMKCFETRILEAPYLHYADWKWWSRCEVEVTALTVDVDISAQKTDLKSMTNALENFQFHRVRRYSPFLVTGIVFSTSSSYSNYYTL